MYVISCVVHTLRPCLHKDVFDLKRSCLDMFYLFCTLKHPKMNMYSRVVIYVCDFMCCSHIEALFTQGCF